MQEDAAVQVGSHKHPLPLKLCSGGLTRADAEVNGLGHS